MCDCLCTKCIHSRTKKCRPCLPRCAKGFLPVEECEDYEPCGEGVWRECLGTSVEVFGGVIICAFGDDCERCYERFMNEQDRID